MSLHYFAFHSTKRRSENVTGEEGRNILDNFSVWLLSRFAGHSCFPARRPFAISSPCALRREHNDHRARERTTQSLLTAKWAVSDRSWLKHTDTTARTNTEDTHRKRDTNADDLSFVFKTEA